MAMIAEAIERRLRAMGIAGPEESVRWTFLTSSSLGWRGLGCIGEDTLRVETLGSDASISDLRALASLTETIANDRVLSEFACLPLPLARRIAAYRCAGTLQSLAHIVASSAADGGSELENRRLKELAQRLAFYLACLHHHRCSPDADERPEFPSLRVECAMPWLGIAVDKSAGATRGIDLAAELRQRSPELLRALVRAAIQLEPRHGDGATALVHGQFDPAHIMAPRARGELTFQLMGWWKLAIGYPELDVGWFIGELTELEEACGGNTYCSTMLRDVAAEFLTSYERATDRQLDYGLTQAVAAMKTLHHLWEFSHVSTIAESLLTSRLELASQVIRWTLGGGAQTSKPKHSCLAAELSSAEPAEPRRGR
jgi:hypothetical protein